MNSTERKRMKKKRRTEKRRKIKFDYFVCNKTRESRIASLPNSGIASDTCGNVSATKLRNTVSDRRIVTPIK
jgi:hypothetical protein